MFCPKCGIEIKEQKNFCPNCGAQLTTGVNSGDSSKNPIEAGSIPTPRRCRVRRKAKRNL